MRHEQARGAALRKTIKPTKTLSHSSWEESKAVLFACLLHLHQWVIFLHRFCFLLSLCWRSISLYLFFYFFYFFIFSLCFTFVRVLYIHKIYLSIYLYDCLLVCFLFCFLHPSFFPSVSSPFVHSSFLLPKILHAIHNHNITITLRLFFRYSELAHLRLFPRHSINPRPTLNPKQRKRVPVSTKPFRRPWRHPRVLHPTEHKEPGAGIRDVMGGVPHPTERCRW